MGTNSMERFNFYISPSVSELHNSGIRKTINPITWVFNLFFTRLNSLSNHIFYFLSLSVLGYSILKSLNTRTARNTVVPRNIDLFFTAVSAATESSMSVVEMEVFSTSQLLLITFLMFVGSEIFVSLLGLIINLIRNSTGRDQAHELEMGTDQTILKKNSIRFLSFVLLSYLSTIHVLGIVSLSLYMAFHTSARNILRNKGLESFTFSLFTVVSSFANCGFIPTNENMMVFGNNSGFLLILIPQILLGNTMFPPCLRLCVWLAGKLFPKRRNIGEYCEFLLRNTEEEVVAKGVLLPARQCAYLAATVVGFIGIQIIMVCALNWNVEGMKGWSSIEKVVGGAFMAVNSRHAGETVVDLSTLSPAVLVIFVVMMYLPPCTVFLPTLRNNKQSERIGGEGIILINNNNDAKEMKRRTSNVIVENVIFSQLCFLITFIVMICITERDNFSRDPLNFNVFNIALEVVREICL
ncbi:Sodium transporter HKT1 [Linum perenne]